MRDLPLDDPYSPHWEDYFKTLREEDALEDLLAEEREEAFEMALSLAQSAQDPIAYAKTCLDSLGHAQSICKVLGQDDHPASLDLAKDAYIQALKATNSGK